MLARDAGRTLRGVAVFVLVTIGLAGIAVGLWALRPTPDYSSAAVTAGSPFEVTFEVRNQSLWFALDNLRIYCVLASVRGSSQPPAIAEATGVTLRSGAGGLAPQESATFTCPFRRLLPTASADDPGIAQRAEIYFRSQYDLPFVGTLRLTDNSPNYVLNTQLLPPQWTRKPEP